MKNKGFTLIELLVVIGIIGILSSIVLTTLTDARAKARDTKWLSELQQIRTAMTIYKNDTSSYPVGVATTQSEFKTVLQPLVSGGYFDDIPVSVNSAAPWNLVYYNCESIGSCSSIGPEWTNEGYVILFTTESLEPNLTEWFGFLDWYLTGSPD